MASIPQRSSQRSGSAPVNSFLHVRTPREYLGLIRVRWWWGFVLGVVLAAPLVWVQLRKPVLYSSSGSVIFQRSDSQRALEVKAVSDVDPNLRFQMEQIRSGPFLNKVAATFSEEEIRRIQAGYLADPQWKRPLPSPRELLGGIQVSVFGDLQMIRVTLVGRSSDEPAILVNRLLDTFIRERAEQTARTDTGALVFLRAQAKDLRHRIEEQERRFVEFRQNLNMVSIEDSQALITARMATLTTAVTQTRTERLELEATYLQLREAREEERPLLELPFIAGDPQVSALRAEKSRLDAEATTLARRYLERHPRVIENQARREDLDIRLEVAVAGAARIIEDRFTGLGEREARLRAELASATEDQLKLDKASVELSVLRRQIESDTRTLDRLLEQIGEQEIASQLASANVMRWEEAVPGPGIGVNRNQVYALAAILVLFLMVGLPIAVDLADQRLKSSADVETHLDTNLVGEIPELKSFERGNAFLGSDTRNDIFQESFRGIYSQITLQNRKEGQRRLIVTSSVPGEGKSFVAANLAAIFGTHHLKTLIVDCDFRRPTQHLFLNRSAEPGTRQWVDSDERFPAHGIPPSLGVVEIQPNLWLLPTGGDTRHPTELLSHSRFAEMIQRFSSFDVIVFDTPPIGLFPDALLVAKLCTEAVFVARFGEAHRGRIRDYLQRLRSAVPVLQGVIMNRMPENPRSPYYYKGYNYGSEKYAEYYKQGSKP